MAFSSKTVIGAVWTVGGSIASRIVTLVGTWMVAQILNPAIMGEVGVASVLVLSASNFSSFGLGQYVVNKPKAGRNVVFHATFYWLLFGFLAFAILMLFRHQLAPFFSSPKLVYYLPGLGVAMLMDRIAYMPERILARDLRFRAISGTRAIAEVVYASSAVLMAWQGFGGNAMVYANILQSLFRLVVFVSITPRIEWLEPCRLKMEHTRDLFRYGLPLSIGVNANYAASKWDGLLFARYLGPPAMGLYTYAYTLASVPANNVGEQIGDVLNPSFAHMDMERRKVALVRATALLGLIVFPLAVGLGAVSDSLVKALFKAEWHEMAPLLMVLSVTSIVRPISSNIFAFLLTCDRPRLIMILEVGKVVAVLATVALTAPYGVEEASLGVGAVYTLVAIVDVLVVKWLDQIPVMGFVRATFAPLLACAPMGAAVVGVQHGMSSMGWTRPGLQLIVGIVVGIVVYVPSAFLFAGGITRELLDLIRNARQRRRGGDDAAPDSVEYDGGPESTEIVAPVKPVVPIKVAAAKPAPAKATTPPKAAVPAQAAPSSKGKPSRRAKAARKRRK
jgi:lipopolysaccharide exporter